MRKNLKKAVFVLCFIPVAFFTWAGEGYMATGLDAYSEGDFSTSIIYFQKAVEASGGKNEEAQYWLTMALASSKNYDSALVEAKRFLAVFPGSLKRPDMLYQRGRLECATGNFELAISTLYDFIDRYPKNKEVSSAYFWIGEALYNSARFEEARTIFSVVLLDYPDSAKVEPAKYKLALIDQAATQSELLRLLKLSNEETVRLSDELEKLKAQYANIQRDLQNKASDAGATERVKELEGYLVEERRKNAELYDKLTLLQMKNDELSTMIANFANATYLEEEPKPAEPAPAEVTELPPSEPEVSEEELRRRAALEELIRKATLLQGMYDEVLEEEAEENTASDKGSSKN